MSAELDLYDPRVDPEPADWAEFRVAQRLPVPWDYQLMRTESTASANPILLAVARQDGVPVAAAVMLVSRPGAWRAGARPGLLRGAARFGPRWAEVGSPWVSGEPGYHFCEQLDPLARKDILRSIERAVCRFVGPGCLGLVYWHIPAADLELTGGRGRYVHDGIGTAVLSNRFATLDDYFAVLSGKRRRDIHRQLRILRADSDLHVRVGSARTDLDPVELAELVRVHRAKYGAVRFDSRGPVTADYLAELLPQPEVYTVSYHDGSGRLLAFNNVLDHPVRMLSQHWAVRPLDDGGRKHLYFDLFVRLVAMMIERDRRALSMGRGLADLKSQLGCAVWPLHVVVVPRPVAG